MAAVNERQELSLGDLFAEMTRDFGVLIRKELELAKVETKTEIGRAGKAAGAYGGTAVTGYFAVFFLSVALALGLSALMPDGLAFLLVGLAYAAGSAVLYVQGRNRMAQVNPVPEQTVETLKEDVAWAKAQTR
jgi:hypothetical protein